VWISFEYSVNREQLEREGFDEVVIATGVVPRALKIQGSDAPQVLSYAEVLKALSWA
jgi:2,4-dienoyl-CoA reductase (NADPH2)